MGLVAWNKMIDWLIDNTQRHTYRWDTSAKTDRTQKKQTTIMILKFNTECISFENVLKSWYVPHLLQAFGALILVPSAVGFWPQTDRCTGRSNYHTTVNIAFRSSRIPQQKVWYCGKQSEWRHGAANVIHSTGVYSYASSTGWMLPLWCWCL